MYVCMCVCVSCYQYRDALPHEFSGSRDGALYIYTCTQRKTVTYTCNIYMYVCMYTHTVMYCRTNSQEAEMVCYTYTHVHKEKPLHTM